MKKIIFILLTLTAFFIVGCNDNYYVPDPDPIVNNNNGETPDVLLYNFVSDYGWNHHWSEPILLKRVDSGNGVKLYFKISLNASTVDPTGLHISKFSIPRVNKNGVTTYWNATGEATFELQGFDKNGYLYFYIISSPNQSLKFNFSIGATYTIGYISDSGDWFLVIPEDDYINNMVEITT